MISPPNTSTRNFSLSALPRVPSPLSVSWTPADFDVSASDSEEVASNSEGATSGNEEAVFDLEEEAAVDDQEMVPISVTPRKRFRWSIAPTPSKQRLSRSSDKIDIFAPNSEGATPNAEEAAPEGEDKDSDSESETMTNPMQVHLAPVNGVGECIETGGSVPPERFSLHYYRYYIDNGQDQEPITGFCCMACDSKLATEWPGPDTCDRCTRFGRLATFPRHDALVRMPIRMSLKGSINVHDYLLEEKYTVSTNF